MFSKKWAEANGATQAQAASATSLNPFALKANGTGPFMIVSHEPGVKTVFKPQPQLVGQAGAQPRRGDLPDHQVGRHARRRAAVGRHRHDGPGAGAGHRARQEQPQRDGADRARDPHHLPQHGFHARRAALLQRQGQEPLQGCARAQGLLPGDRHRGDPHQGHARHVGQLGADDLAAAVRARRRVQALAL